MFLREGNASHTKRIHSSTISSVISIKIMYHMILSNLSIRMQRTYTHTLFPTRYVQETNLGHRVKVRKTTTTPTTPTCHRPHGIAAGNAGSGGPATALLVAAVVVVVVAPQAHMHSHTGAGLLCLHHVLGRVEVRRQHPTGLWVPVADTSPNLKPTTEKQQDSLVSLQSRTSISCMGSS